MVFFRNCDALLEYAVQEDDIYIEQTYTDFERFGYDCIAPFKHFKEVEEDSSKDELARFGSKVMRNILTPLALVGALFKQHGEDSNPAKELRCQIREKQKEVRQLFKTLPDQDPLSLITKGIGLMAAELKVRKKLLEHLEKESESENCQVGKEIIAALHTPLIGIFLATSVLKEKDATIPVIEKWFTPSFAIRQKLDAYKSDDAILDIEQEIQSMVAYAKEIAPEDAEWHKEIVSLFETTKEITKTQPIMLKIQAVATEIDTLKETLRLQKK